MPTIAPNTNCSFVPGADTRLRYAPPAGVQLVVAVEAAALRAPHNALTTVMAHHDGKVSWVGSIDEAMIAVSPGQLADARQKLSDLLLLPSPRLFEVIRPGWLRTYGLPIRDTVYQGDRPWIVIAESPDFGLLALPLNDFGTGPRGHYHHGMDQADLMFPDSKNSKVELAHIWSFPPNLPAIGVVRDAARPMLEQAVRGYFPGRA